MKIIKPQKSMVDQVNEVLAQNRRILAMNESLLRAILNPPVVVETAKLDMDEMMRTLHK